MCTTWSVMMIKWMISQGNHKQQVHSQMYDNKQWVLIIAHHNFNSVWNVQSVVSHCLTTHRVSKPSKMLILSLTIQMTRYYNLLCYHSDGINNRIWYIIIQVRPTFRGWKNGSVLRRGRSHVVELLIIPQILILLTGIGLVHSQLQYNTCQYCWGTCISQM